ncbi:hypothetical protein DSO57_1022179 [Entomophthora muscae]|uniref:Uncharacterized protein n=1 Tax=Entomophthora muscae TaxID=34485 RepID=A0ACC2TQS9_9FUNG|nr:hypothetical protein DSO57_1022179 [Entomophthora muscae]
MVMQMLWIFLLSRPEGCDVNQVNEAGNTALHWAALNGSLEVAKLLVGAGANVLLKNQIGRTSFYEAKQGGHEEVAEYLLELIDQAECSDDEEESTESAQ